MTHAEVKLQTIDTEPNLCRRPTFLHYVLLAQSDAVEAQVRNLQFLHLQRRRIPVLRAQFLHEWLICILGAGDSECLAEW